MKKILAIDDQKDNLLVLKALIKDNLPDCEVITSESGTEGIRIAIEKQPDTIILDIIMPVIDGYQVCKKLKENELTKHIPVIMLTAIKTDIKSRVKGLNIGADAFLSKPIDHIELSAQLNVMLRIKEMEDKLRSDKNNLEKTVEEKTKELLTANKELKDALSKATESDHLKSVFLATMSHELRTPLNAIIGFSEFLDKDLSPDSVEEFGKTINSSGNHLLNIINDLFDITLIQSGEIKVKFENVSLKPIFYEINNIIISEKNRINKKNVELKLLTPPEEEVIAINTDPFKLKQIMINLLRNALKFTKKGHIHYGYNIIPDPEKPLLNFYVEDTGIGIPKNKKNFIFDMFRQVEDSYTRSFEGVGLGLSISKKLTELLGGNIYFESVEGVGSTFRFTLPYDKLEEKSTIKKDRSSEKKDYLNKKTILIVEDDEISYKYIEIVLNKAGINSLWAKNGEESIKFCNENSNIDLVLMDINMPVLNGYGATKEIRKFHTDLPIIAQTAYAITGDREKSINAGCNDYITKPIKPDLLLKKINKFWNNKQL